MALSPEPNLRWSRWFGHAAEPLFLLNGRRKLVFVNSAFEKLTGFTWAEVKGQACRRRPRTVLANRLEQLLAALAPPPEVLHGAPTYRRILLPLPSDEERWAKAAFFPFQGPEGLLGILGKVTMVQDTLGKPHDPLPERLLALRDLNRVDLASLDFPSLPAQRLLQQVRLIAPLSTPVLLVGPPGSGKRWLARALHLASSQKAAFFACLDCAVLPPSALADILFGASSRRLPLGTIYLHEADRLPRDWQLRLTQQWQNEAANISQPRLIVGAATEPAGSLAGSSWLPEFYFQVSPFTLRVPALQERVEDLPLLVERLLERARLATGAKVDALSPECWDILRPHAWPGNLRELAQVLRVACLRAKGPCLAATDLPLYLRQVPAPPEKKLALDPLLEQVEKRLLTLALRLAQDNKKKAADILAIWRPRLLRRIEALGLAPKENGSSPPASDSDTSGGG